MARRFRAGIERRESEAVKQLTDAYVATMAEITRRLDALILEIAEAEALGIPVDETTTQWASELSTLANDMADAIDSVLPVATDIAKNGQVEMALFSYENTNRMLQTIVSDAPPQVNLVVNELNRDALDAFVGFASDGSPLDKIFRQVGLDARDQLQADIAIGTNPREAAENMVRTGQGSYRRMETIARTEMIRANREVSRQTFMANDDIMEGWIRVCAGDARVCIVCWSLHGTMHKTSEVMPSHPNCRCGMVPKTKPWSEIVGDETLPDTAPEIPSREELFDRLSDYDKREVLGPARYQMWKNGTSLAVFGTTKNDPVWGPTAVPRTLSELRSMEV